MEKLNEFLNISFHMLLMSAANDFLYLWYSHHPTTENRKFQLSILFKFHKNQAVAIYR